jgi:tetratricopeptide (TPR) repeat protein
MARKLGAQNLLQGSVRRDANSVAINVQLMNGADGASVWSKTYSAEPDDFTALLPVITRAVADALGFKVDLQPRREIAPSAIITNDLYLQGLLLSRKTNSDDLRTSLDFLRLALAKEQFPRALTISAKDWTRLGESYVRPREAYAEAHKAAREALATNDRDAEAHAYLGEAERVLAWDLKNEESELKRALELDPNCAIAHYFLARLKLFLGDSNSAQQHLDAAKQIDPLSPVIGDLEVYLNVATGRLDQAFAAAQRTMEIDPDYQYFEADLALVYREQGRFAEAIDIYLRLETTRHQPQPGLAITYARSNRPDDARKVLNQLTEFAKTQYFPAEQIAAVFAALGNRDDAFRWLDRAANEHSAGIHQIGCAREFEPLRADPRFAGLLRRIGIDPKNFVRK